MSIGIAYNPCKNCKEMDKCSICELTYYRKGYIKSPTADTVEVVRCKDCKRCKKFKRIDGTYFFSCRSGCFKEVVSADHYCSYGERKDENEG